MDQIPFGEGRTKRIRHYHGGVVRNLFILAGLILLVAIPIFSELLPVSVFTLILAVVVLIIFAALTNPKLRWVNIVDVVISAFGVVIFEFLAVANYAIDAVSFFASQALAIIFLFALYFSARTARAIATGQLDPEAVKDAEEMEEMMELGEEKTNEEVLHDIKKGEGY